VPEDPDVIEKFFLTANPNPERAGCPGRDTLKAIAENTLSVQHPARLHLASCSPCFGEFQQLKDLHRASRLKVRRNLWLATLAACFLLGVVGFRLLIRNASAPVATISSSLVRTIDLYDVGTVRGVEPSRISDTVLLPATSVKLRLILPRFSQSGQYRIGVVRDKSGKAVLAEGTGATVADGPRQVVTVTLNLRSVPSGSYLLATTRGDDQASYYYPVKVD
jgi:hypothetical protein